MQGSVDELSILYGTTQHNSTTNRNQNKVEDLYIKNAFVLLYHEHFISSWKLQKGLFLFGSQTSHLSVYTFLFFTTCFIIMLRCACQAAAAVGHGVTRGSSSEASSLMFAAASIPVMHSCTLIPAVGLHRPRGSHASQRGSQRPRREEH